MTIEAIKKALEDLDALVTIVAKDTGALVMSDPDEDSVGSTLEGDLEMTFGHVRRAHQALSTLESLQRENSQLRVQASNYAADAETVRRERDAADARESKLREALTKLVREAGVVSNFGAVPGRQWTLLACALINARATLSSTGDTHGN